MTIDTCGNGFYHNRGTSPPYGYPDNLEVKNCIITNILNYNNGYSSDDQHAIATQAGTDWKFHDNYVNGAGTGITFYNGYDVAADAEIYNNFVTNLYRFLRGKSSGMNSGSESTKLVDPEYDFTSIGVINGTKLYNITDGNGTVNYVTTTVNSNDTVILSGALTGGSDNTFTKEDMWHFSPTGANYPATGHGCGYDMHGNTAGVVTDIKFDNKHRHLCLGGRNTDKV